MQTARPTGCTIGNSKCKHWHPEQQTQNKRELVSHSRPRVPPSTVTAETRTRSGSFCLGPVSMKSNVAFISSCYCHTCTRTHSQGFSTSSLHKPSTGWNLSDHRNQEGDLLLITTCARVNERCDAENSVFKPLKGLFCPVYSGSASLCFHWGHIYGSHSASDYENCCLNVCLDPWWSAPPCPLAGQQYRVPGPAPELLN